MSRPESPSNINSLNARHSSIISKPPPSGGGGGNLPRRGASQHAQYMPISPNKKKITRRQTMYGDKLISRTGPNTVFKDDQGGVLVESVGMSATERRDWIEQVKNKKKGPLYSSNTKSSTFHLPKIAASTSVSVKPPMSVTY